MSKKVLIIDDDLDFTEAVHQVLETKGYTTLTAVNGKEGLAKVQKEPPDLILLDVMMTKMTEGFDVAKALKKMPGADKIPVILVTGIRRELHLPFGFEKDDEWLPVTSILEKPVPPATLLNAVQKALAAA